MKRTWRQTLCAWTTEMLYFITIRLTGLLGLARRSSSKHLYARVDNNPNGKNYKSPLCTYVYVHTTPYVRFKRSAMF